MRVVDAFCGAGGWSAGAIAAGCMPVLGIDSDTAPLKLWATNCTPAGRAVCATIGKDTIEWPEAAPDVHVHLSPPCTSLSKARAGSATASSVAAALDAVRWCVQLVLDKGYASWSMENVATPAVVACVAELARQHPDRVAQHLTLDAADYGVGSNRVRLIASTPAVIKALKEMPVQRVSVAEALAAAGLPLPAEYLKPNTSNRDSTPCMRSTQQPAFTVTASHPLIWCTRAGATVRCLTVAESAALMGFPPDWKLPLGSRAGLRAVGNAVPPLLAKAVMTCAVTAAQSPPACWTSAPAPPAQEPAQEPARRWCPRRPCRSSTSGAPATSSRGCVASCAGSQNAWTCSRGVMKGHWRTREERDMEKLCHSRNTAKLTHLRQQRLSETPPLRPEALRPRCLGALSNRGKPNHRSHTW